MKFVTKIRVLVLELILEWQKREKLLHKQGNQVIISSSGFVAQLVRALPCHGRGREFESRRIRQNKALRAIFCGLKIEFS